MGFPTIEFGSANLLNYFMNVCGFNVHLMGVPRGSEKHVAATAGRKK
jgi:hypothetical protein